MIQSFQAIIEIIGINPFVFVPEQILQQLFKEAGKEKGYIPVCGTVNGKKYLQTLVKYKGQWRLYINTTMLKNSPKRIGETVDISIQPDPIDRALQPHPRLVKALLENPQAKEIFDHLAPSTQKEIIRYISFLKSEESVSKNIEKAIGFLTGKNRFIGRGKP